MRNRIYINVEDVILYLENFSFPFQPIILQNILLKIIKINTEKLTKKTKKI